MKVPLWVFVAVVVLAIAATACVTLLYAGYSCVAELTEMHAHD